MIVNIDCNLIPFSQSLNVEKHGNQVVLVLNSQRHLFQKKRNPLENGLSQK